jgi:hypothetical protein
MRLKCSFVCIIILIIIITSNSLILASRSNEKLDSLTNVNDLIKTSINNENWFFGKWSNMWELDNVGKVKTDFYLSDDGEEIGAYIHKKLSQGGKEKYYCLLTLSKDVWGFSEYADITFLETKKELDSEIKSEDLKKIGSTYINFGKAQKPKFGEITSEKSKVINSIEKYIKTALQDDSKKGEFKLYFQDFEESRPGTNVVIEDSKGRPP